jgi:hemerythrin-like domain-containing protein
MTAPDLTMYRLVHRALRVGTAGIAEAAADIHTADERRRTAFAKYWNGYAAEVLGHHTVEDEIFFPALVDRVPVAGALIERTDADHHHLDELMEAIGRAVGQVRHGLSAPELPALTRELVQHMDTHLDFEDADILPLFERHFTGDEYGALNEAALKSAGVGKQAAFAVPFIVSVMTDDERQKALTEAPLPLRLLYRATRRSHTRLTERAIGRQYVGAA